MKEPVAVASFGNRASCMAALPRELKKARRMTPVVYADCIPVQAELLAGRAPIRQRIEPQRLAALVDGVEEKAKVPLLAVVAEQSAPIPYDRY